MHEQGKQIILWNWTHKSAHSLVMRFKKEYKSLFKCSINIDDLVYQLKAEAADSHVQDIITR